VGQAEAELGPITLLVNCASVFEEDAFADMNRASWDSHIETNRARRWCSPRPSRGACPPAAKG